MIRIGILSFLHESNTFVAQQTSLAHFQSDLYLEGREIVSAMEGSHHEVGGFLESLRSKDVLESIECVPLLMMRATPSGTITYEAFQSILHRTQQCLKQAGQLDGLLVAAHGAAVADGHLDADGTWLSCIRSSVGHGIPIVATLDAHANLTPTMVQACDGMIVYRTNPHLDQRERGREAGQLLLRILDQQVRPCMRACFLPLVINIERQSTDEPHLRKIYYIADQQLQDPNVLSNSIVLGFPYSDVREMGCAAIVVTDNDPQLAERLVQDLAQQLWNARSEFEGHLISIDEALQIVEQSTETPIVLLDMGDNVGGGSAADGTCLAQALEARKIGPSFVCIYDPLNVERCDAHGVGSHLDLSIGAHSDTHHGRPLQASVVVESLHEGRFREERPRHGGITNFDQGRTAIVRCVDSPLTIMLTSKRMVPFSLRQLSSCGLNPAQFRVLIAKGVHAPLAAYREVAKRFLRVNTPGSTCADVLQLPFQKRRYPLYPMEKAGFGACEKVPSVMASGHQCVSQK